MPSASQLYGGGFLKASDLQPLGKHRIVVITDATAQTVGQDQKQMLGLSLATAQGAATDKILLLNKTNMLQLVSGFGDNYNEWIGRRIEIWSENVSFQGRLVPGIKVMPVRRAAPPAAPPPPDDLPPDAEPDGSIDDDAIPF